MYEAFLTKIDTNTGGIVYSTLLGGTDEDAALGVALDATNRVYVTGHTRSTTFPTTVGAYDSTFNSGLFPQDAWVAKFDTTAVGAASLVYSTLVGGTDLDRAFGIAVDALGQAHVVGESRSVDFPQVAPLDTFMFGPQPVFFVVNPAGSGLVLSTWLTGGGNGRALNAVAVNALGETYIGGGTNNDVARTPALPHGFPLVNAYQGTYGGGDRDALIMKIGRSADLQLTKSGTPNPVLPNQNVTWTLTLTNNGPDASSGITVSDPLPATMTFVSGVVSAGGSISQAGNAVSVTFANLAAGASATISIVAKVNLGIGADTSITNTATVTSAVADSVPANNTATATVSTPSLNPTGDADGDGLPNGWEGQFGLDPFDNSPANGAGGDPDGDGRTNIQELGEGSHPRGFVITYLAEGATGTFFDTRIAIANPTTRPALVLTRFQDRDGNVVPRYQVVPPLTRATIDVDTVPGMENAEFSTLVEADVQVVCDRTMSWDSDGYGAHAERGILTRTATTWYLAEGATHSGFNLFYLFQNPNAVDATVEVTYLMPKGGPIVRSYPVPKTSRYNIWVDMIPELSNTDVSAVVRSTAPIIVERAMYKEGDGRLFNAGHESAGVTALSNDWFLAEGATGNLFDLFVLIANPNQQTAACEATFLLTDGSTVSKTYPVPPESRRTIWVDLEDARLEIAAFSTKVSCSLPTIVERAMWWPGPTGDTWYEAHNSPGETTTGTKWGLAEGESGGPLGKDTFILIANTSAFDGGVQVTLLFEDGTTAAATVPIKANSRTTVYVNGDFPTAANRRFGAIVESIGATPAQVVVERAMYWDALGQRWAAGTNALATKLQ